MQDGAQEEDTRGRRLRKDAGRAAGKEQQKRRVGEDRKKERNEGTHVNKLCRKQEVQAGRTKPEKQGHKRKERLTGTDRNKQEQTGINRGKTGINKGRKDGKIKGRGRGEGLDGAESEGE